MNRTAGRTRGLLHTRLSVLLLMGVVALLAAACYNSTSGATEIKGVARFKLPVLAKTGSHKVMVFNEMHYQPSFRVQEGPRLLPTTQSVAFAGLGGPGLVTQPGMIRIVAVGHRRII